jgi:hypothetical protein
MKNDDTPFSYCVPRVGGLVVLQANVICQTVMTVTI